MNLEKKNCARPWNVCSGGAFDHVNCSGWAVSWSKYFIKTAVLCGQIQENGDMSTAAINHAIKYQLGVEVLVHKLYRDCHIIKN